MMPTVLRSKPNRDTVKQKIYRPIWAQKQTWGWGIRGTTRWVWTFAVQASDTWVQIPRTHVRRWVLEGVPVTQHSGSLGLADHQHSSNSVSRELNGDRAGHQMASFVLCACIRTHVCLDHTYTTSLPNRSPHKAKNRRSMYQYPNTYTWHSPCQHYTHGEELKCFL